MGRLVNLIRGLRGVNPRDEVAPTDLQCLEQFRSNRDEAAFAVLVERHGPMVMGVCRRILGHASDAEDAFQATFLVLVRKASTFTSRDLVANWLYGVAHRTALNARTMAAKRRVREQSVERVPEREAIPHNPGEETGLVLEEELARLPDKYRLPIILCELEGKSHQEAAAQLGWPVGTLSGRLSRARKKLAEQLTRRGVVLGSSGLTGLLSQQAGSALSPVVARATVELAAKVATSGLTGIGVPANVVALTEGVIMSLFLRKLRQLAAVFPLLGMVGTAAAVGVGELPGPDKAAPVVAIRPPVEPPEPVDANGNPLPAGAVARLGTTAFRHLGEVTLAQFSADGKRLITAGTDYTVRVWEYPTGKELHRIDLLAPGPYDKDHALRVPTSTLNNYWAVVLSADGTTLAYNVVPSVTQDGRKSGVIRVWDVRTGKEFRRLPGGQLEDNSHTYSFALTSDGKSLAVCRHTGLADATKRGQGPYNIDIDLWNLADGKNVRTIAAQKQWSSATARIAFSSDGKVLAGLIETGTKVDDPKREGAVRVGSLLCLWDTATGKELHAIPQPGWRNPTGWLPLAFSPDGKQVAAVSGGRVHLHEVASGKPVGEFSLAKDANQKAPRADLSSITAFAITADGKQLLAQWAEVVQAWDLTTATMRTLDLSPEEWRATSSRGRAIMAVTPDSKVAAVLGGDSFRIRFLDLKEFKELPYEGGHTRSPNTIRFLGDGASIMTLGEDRRAYRWDATSGARKAKLHLPHPDLWRLNQLSLDGSTVVTIGRNPEDQKSDEIVLWDTATGEVRVIKTKPLYRWVYTDFTFSQDGKVFALRTADCLDVYDVATREKRGSLKLPPPSPRQRDPKGEQPPQLPFIGRAPLLTPDGGVVVVDCGDGTLRVWEPAKKLDPVVVKLPPLRNNAPRGRNSYDAHLLPYGNTLVLTGIDDEVILLDLITGQTRSVDLSKIEIDNPPAKKVGGREGQRFPRVEPIFAHSADGKAMAALGLNRSLTLIDLVARDSHRVDLPKLELPRPVVKLDPTFTPVGPGGTGGVPTRRIAYSPDGKTLAVLLAPFSTVLLLDAKTGKELGRIKGHEAAITTFSFSPDGKRLATGSQDTTALVFDISKMRPE